MLLVSRRKWAIQRDCIKKQYLVQHGILKTIFPVEINKGDPWVRYKFRGVFLARVLCCGLGFSLRWTVRVKLLLLCCEGISLSELLCRMKIVNWCNVAYISIFLVVTCLHVTEDHKYLGIKVPMWTVYTCFTPLTVHSICSLRLSYRFL